MRCSCEDKETQPSLPEVKRDATLRVRKSATHRFDPSCAGLARHALGAAFLLPGPRYDRELFLLIADVEQVELVVDRVEFRVAVFQAVPTEYECYSQRPLGPRLVRASCHAEHVPNRVLGGPDGIPGLDLRGRREVLSLPSALLCVFRVGLPAESRLFQLGSELSQL